MRAPILAKRSRQVGTDASKAEQAADLAIAKLIRAGFDLDGAELTILAPKYVEDARLDAAGQNDDAASNRKPGDTHGNHDPTLG